MASSSDLFVNQQPSFKLALRVFPDLCHIWDWIIASVCVQCIQEGEGIGVTCSDVMYQVDTTRQKVVS